MYDRSIWFNPASLVRFVDTQTFKRGQTLEQTGKAMVYELVPDEVDPTCWEIGGEVQGTQSYPYYVDVELQIGPKGQLVTWRSHCSCPVAIACKHGIALSLEAAYQACDVFSVPDFRDVIAPLPAAAKSGAPSSNVTHEDLLERQRQHARQLAMQAQAHAEQVWLSTALPSTAPPQPLYPGYGRSTPSEKGLVFVLSEKAINNSPGAAALPTVAELQIRPFEYLLKKNSDLPGPLKPVEQMSHRDEYSARLVSAKDKEVLQLLRSQANPYHYSAAVQAIVLQGQMGRLLLQLAFETGHVHWEGEGKKMGHALKPGPDKMLSWHWQAVQQPRMDEVLWQLLPHAATDATDATDRSGILNREGGAPPASGQTAFKLYANLPPLYVDFATGEVGTVKQNSLNDVQIRQALKMPPLRQALLEDHAEKLAAALPGVALPEGIAAMQQWVGIQPKAVLQITATQPRLVSTLGPFSARLYFAYKSLELTYPYDSPTEMVTTPQGRVLVHRDLRQESDICHSLNATGIVMGPEGDWWPFKEDANIFWAVMFDQQFEPWRQAGVEVRTPPNTDPWLVHAGGALASLEAVDEAQGGGWFDMSLGIEIEGQRHNLLPMLPQLLRNAEQDKTGQVHWPDKVYLPMPDQRMLRLDVTSLKPWLNALLELVGDKPESFNAQSLRLARWDALRVGASLGEGVAWAGADSIRDMLKQLGSANAITPVKIPKGLNASLRPYQHDGVNWLQFLAKHQLGGLLADDMGLGKTLQTLAHLLIEKKAGRLKAPALIVAPVSLLGNWQREAARFCPDLRVQVVHGADRHSNVPSLSQLDVVITAYSLLQRDEARWLAQPWHALVLDEAQNIKNSNTHAARVVAQINAHHRICLSGTPLENHLGELWSLFHFLMPGFLGASARFAKLYRNPIEKHNNTERLDQLRRRVTPFMLRRSKALVANELPPKQETTLPVSLEGAQANLYETIRLSTEETVRRALNEKGLQRSQITILDALLKLRQVCCDPQLLPLGSGKRIKTSAKLDQLMEMLPEMIMEGRKILLFSQFTSMLELIEARLKTAGLQWVKLTGQSTKRDALIAQFTEGKVPLFLISLKAGGVGLNLPQADTVIHYDPWWNPAVENQATDRAHRIGQTKNVWVIKLVAQGTIEERILALQQRKAELANSLYSGAQDRKQALFDESDLQQLLKPLGA
jgi:superfamily II DNA or RNA helicase